MKEFRFFIGSLAVIFIFTALAFAQTPKAEKIGFVNWTAFEDENTGIKELAEIVKKLNEEFEPLNNELRELLKKYQEKVEAIKRLTDPKVIQIGCGPPLQVFVDELKELEIKLIAKSKDGRSLYKKRREEVAGAVELKISKAIEVFAKEKGFAMILDNSKLDRSFVSAEYRNNDVTKEFIKFYNEDFIKRKE